MTTHIPVERRGLQKVPADTSIRCDGKAVIYRPVYGHVRDDCCQLTRPVSSDLSLIHI